MRQKKEQFTLELTPDLKVLQIEAKFDVIID